MASIWCYVIDFRSCAWNNCQGSNRTLCGSAMSRLVKFRGFILIILPRASSSFSFESSPTPGLKGQISDIYWILIRIRREQLTDYYGEKIGTKNIILKANWTKSILPILSSCLRGKHFYTGKMTENEHNYKGPTPMNVTYARFEIQLIDLPRSQASQVFGRKRNCERSGLVTNPPERACRGTR